MHDPICDIVLTIAHFRRNTWLVIPLAIAAAVSVWLACDGRHHWDEPAYLYSGAYQDTDQILAGRIQPSGIPHFSQGRILHALLVKGVMAASGSSTTGYRAMIGLNLVLTVVSIVLMFRLLRELLPDVPERRVAGVLVALTPVILYLAFKVLADNEGLVAALVASWAMFRFARDGSLALTVPATLGLAVAALSKNQMVFMPAAFWAALCIAPIAGVDRKRLVIFGVATGVAGFLLTLAVLEGLGIGVQSYIASYRELADDRVPLVAKVVNIGTELGVLWLLLPFAFATRRRQELRAFLLWFLFSMAPFVLLINSIEARHVAVNLVAVGGLFALAIEAIRERTKRWERLSVASRGAIAATAVAILMASNAFVLAIMPHRVALDQMRWVIAEMDRRYGASRYALLTSTGYTDFQLIRVLWPEVDARDVSTDAISVGHGRGSRQKALGSYLGDRGLDSIAALRALNRPLIYMGYHQTFAAENLRSILSAVSPKLAERLLGKVSLVDRLFSPETRWLWRSPEVQLEPVVERGHYHAFEVKLRPEHGPEDPVGIR